LTKIKGAHGFSITCISISPDRRLIASGSAEGTCCIVSLPIQFPTGLIINPLYTLLLACLVAGILLWITTIVDIQPFFKPEINDTSSSMTTTNLEIPTTTTTATTTTTTIESIVSEIAAETPLVTLTETEILEESTNRDEL
jgi:WD40 repeat protein